MLLLVEGEHRCAVERKKKARDIAASKQSQQQAAGPTGRTPCKRSPTFGTQHLRLAGFALTPSSNSARGIDNNKATTKQQQQQQQQQQLRATDSINPETERNGGPALPSHSSTETLTSERP